MNCFRTGPGISSQSHYFGIEMAIRRAKRLQHVLLSIALFWNWNAPHTLHRYSFWSLNRTILELKNDIKLTKAEIDKLSQSHYFGIEKGYYRMNPTQGHFSQSHYFGIEKRIKASWKSAVRSLNRTILELKRLNPPRNCKYNPTLNRTILELKI